ncbi:MAG: hypothetical protein ACP5GY_06510 [Vulcanisaeta sp.]
MEETGNSNLLEEITRNFRLSYEKSGLTVYIVPGENVRSFMGNGLTISNEDVTLYGTRINLYLPCDGIIYGRQLVQINDELRGLYAVIVNSDCEISIDWKEQGISVNLQLRADEALVILVRLMRFSRRKIHPDTYATRLMRKLGIEGKLVYSDLNGEIQIFRIKKGIENLGLSNCVNEVMVKVWRLRFDPCAQISQMMNDGTNLLIIGGTNTLSIERYYPALNTWYELRKINGPGNYLVILKG